MCVNTQPVTDFPTELWQQYPSYLVRQTQSWATSHELKETPNSFCFGPKSETFHLQTRLCIWIRCRNTATAQIKHNSNNKQQWRAQPVTCSLILLKYHRYFYLVFIVTVFLVLAAILGMYTLMSNKQYYDALGSTGSIANTEGINSTYDAIHKTISRKVKHWSDS